MDKAERIEQLVARHRDASGPLLPLLHAVQAEFGCIDDDAKRQIADGLNLSRAEVHGVVSFYPDFRQSPATRPIIKICRAEACQARGVDTVLAATPTALLQAVELQNVYCLGLCSAGPAALVGEAPHARLDSAKLALLIGEMV